MKTKLFISVLALSCFLVSCKKENMQDTATVTGSDFHETGTTNTNTNTSKQVNPGDIPTIPYGLLGLEGGTFTINSSTALIGNVGYSRNVTSGTNQKIDQFTGAADIDSRTSAFNYTAATYQPTGGIHRGGPVNNQLDDANDDALLLSSTCAALTPNYILGAVTTNQTINAAAPNTVVQMSSMSYNSKILTLNGIPGQDDGFIINISGNFDFAQSEIRLNNVRPERVIFNFPNASAITVNKAATIFRGTILAPVGSVIYHNPASFLGAIIAKNIAVHSAFNLTQHSFQYSTVS